MNNKKDDIKIKSNDANLDSDSKKTPSVARSTLLMTVGTLLSRATGLIRTWMMAYALGASALASAYQVANNLPNIIYETIAGGMIAAAFLPVLMMVSEKIGKDEENRYASNILNIVAVILGTVSFLGIVFAEPLIATQTFTVDASDNEVVAQAVWMFRIFSLQVLFYGLAGVVQGMLNAHRAFFISALAPGLNNIVVICSFAAYALLSSIGKTDVGLIALTVGTTLGVVVQFAVQMPFVLKNGFKWQPILSFSDNAFRETVKIAIPTIVFVVASIIGQSARNAFSLSASDSGPAMIQYAWLWFQLPYGVIAVSLARTLFTEMSDAAAREDIDSLRGYVSSGLRQTLCLMIPCAACLVALAIPLTMVFQSGAFTADDTMQVAHLLSVWAIGLPFYSVWSYLYNAFASMRRFMPFALLNMALICLQVAMYAILTSSPLGLLGIPAADLIYYIVFALCSWVLVKKVMNRFEQRTKLRNAELSSNVVISSVDSKRYASFFAVLKIVLASGIGLIVMLCLQIILPDPYGAVSAILTCCIVAPVGLLVIILFAYALKVDAVTNVCNRFVQKFSRKS